MRPASLLFASAFTFVSTLALAVVVYLQHKSGIEFYFNADSLSLPTLIKDLFFAGGSVANFANWYANSAPDFITDWPLYWIAELLSPKIHTGWAIFFVLQYLLSLVPTYFVLRFFFDTKSALTWTLAMTSWLVVISSAWTHPYYLSIVGGYHYNEVILFTASLALMLKAIQSNEIRLYSGTLSCLAVIAAFATVSDRLYLIHATAPFLLLAYLFKKRNWVEENVARSYWQLAKATAIGSVAGIVLSKIIIKHNTTYPYKIDLRVVPRNLLQLLQSLEELLTANAVAPFALLFIVVFYWAAFRAIRGRQSPLRLLMIVFAWSALFSIGVFVFGNMNFTSRYMMTAFILPIVFAPLVFQILTVPPALLRALAILAMLIPPLAMATRALQDPSAIQDDYVNADLACIERVAAENNLKSGIAQYWLTKPLRLLAKQKLEIAPYRMEGGSYEAFNWSSSTAWFKDSYDFAIISTGFPEGSYERLNEEQLVQMNGAPFKTENCGGERILIYAPGTMKVPPKKAQK